MRSDQRERKRYLSGVIPFGWKVAGDGTLVEDPAQQRAIQRILDPRRDGLSLRAISNAITADGTKLSHEGVKNVLVAAGGTEAA